MAFSWLFEYDGRLARRVDLLNALCHKNCGQISPTLTDEQPESAYQSLLIKAIRADCKS